MNDDIRAIAQEVYDANIQIDQFGVSQTPFHTHNGSDSQRIPYQNIKDKVVVIQHTIYGTSAATAGNYDTFFIAPFQMTVTDIKEVHSVLGTDGGAVTLQIEKLTGTKASGTGLALLTTPFNLKSTINTVVTGVLTPLVGLVQLNAGDRLALLKSGTLTSVSNVSVVVTLKF